MAEKRKKILFIVEAMGGGVFTYMVEATYVSNGINVEKLEQVGLQHEVIFIAFTGSYREAVAV